MQATEPQTEYLVTLFLDCGFTREQRKAWLKNRFGVSRDYIFLDELTKVEASQAINELKQMKEDR